MSFQDVGPRPVARQRRRSSSSKRIQPPPPTTTTESHEENTSPNDAERARPRRQWSSASRRTCSSPDRSVIATKTSKRSRFGRLNEEILHFQGMVQQLEILVKHSGDTPENQWRSRILLQSAEETDQDIGVKMNECKLTLGSVQDPAVRASHKKLMRDYDRAHQKYKSLSSEYLRLQLKDISQFGGETMTPESLQQRLEAKREEDFFVRAMREREEELDKINRSMHHVNEIYKELGCMVESQQEQIDQVEDHVQDSKRNADAGLDELMQANIAFCAPLPTATTSSSRKEKRIPPPRMTDDDFRWSMPFETLHDDMMEVKKDIVGLGKDIVRTSSRKLRSAGGMLKCGPGGDEWQQARTPKYRHRTAGAKSSWQQAETPKYRHRRSSSDIH